MKGMKSMKKTISTFVASVMAVSAINVIAASAIDNTNENNYYLTTSELETAVVASDGTVIPAGSKAVTVNVSENTGFVSKSVMLDIGSANIIVGADNFPIVEKGEVIGDSIISCAENNGNVMIASASVDTNNFDGEMFTFYVSPTDQNILIVDIDTQINLTMPAMELISYMIGDVDNDGYINASDASFILHAISVYEDEEHDDALPIEVANNNLSKYFPYCMPSDARAADSNESKAITDYDARCVMNYYSTLSVGGTPSVEECASVGIVKYDII